VRPTDDGPEAATDDEQQAPSVLALLSFDAGGRLVGVLSDTEHNMLRFLRFLALPYGAKKLTAKISPILFLYCSVT
jgi:hypothetical protein